MKEIKIGRTPVTLPESWEEMTRDQYWTYMLLLAAVMAGELHRLEAEKTFFSFLIGWNGADWTRMADQDTADTLREVFMEDRKWWGMDRLPDTGCLNLMPVWRGRLGSYRGPEDWLADMTWGVFTDCLDLLAAVSSDDSAEPMARLASLMYSLPPEESPDAVLQYHCMALLKSVVDAVSSGPVSVNGHDVDLSVIFGKGGGSGDGTGMTGVTFAVAEAGVFGDYASVRKTGIWEVMLYLYKCRKSKENEKRHEAV